MLKGLENGQKGSGSIKLKGELTVYFSCENTEKNAGIYKQSLLGEESQKELGHVLWILNGKRGKKIQEVKFRIL